MSTEAPIETLAAFPSAGVSDEVARALDQDLDQARVRSKQGKSYLAVHDVIRVANRIFGFGRWGYEVVDLSPLGSTPKTGKEGKQGVYVGYRCTVKLTVAGCLPVSGVGYGDGVEYQEQSAVTAHELAVKEAESDALKRAFRNFGDQFGLILYAKEDEARRIAAEKQQEQAVADAVANAATDEGIEELRQMASRVGPDVREKTDAAIKAHRDKNETERGLGPIVTRKFLADMATAIAKQGEEKAKAAGEAARAEAEAGATSQTGLKVPDGVVTDGTAQAEGDVANVESAFGA